MLAYGLRGHVFRSSDGGQSWSQVDTGLPVSITAATLDEAGRFWLFSQAGHNLLGQDGGTRFKAVPRESLAPVTGAATDSAGNLLLVGERGVRALPVE
ncbi:hypothetical protein D3C75_1200100 [compost metagenome]